MKKTIAGLVAATAVATGAGVLAAAPADAAGGCISRAEFRHIHNGMSPTRVAHIVGSKGKVDMAYGSGAYRTVIRSYDTCTAWHVSNVTFTGGRVAGKLYI